MDKRLDNSFAKQLAKQFEEELRWSWSADPRWKDIRRVYSPADVLRLRGSVTIEHTLAKLGAERLRELLGESQGGEVVSALGAVTGNQAVQQVQAGLRAIYCSGWQVAADANDAGQTYPDQSLYPSGSVPHLVRRINQALRRADQIQTLEGKGGIHWFAPVVADAEAGFGGNLNAFELTQSMIEAGAAAVHFEDQLASAKKCGHMGGKVLVPTSEFIEKLAAARLAADVLNVPTVLIARTDANGAFLITSDVDPRDHEFIVGGPAARGASGNGGRTAEGFFRIRGGLDCAIARALAYAPYADMLWCETSEPALPEARRFAEAVLAKHPGKWLAYNCSPSFNWKKKLDERALAGFRRELGAMGYKFQFITLAGFHALNLGMFELARRYVDEGMPAYARLQENEFAAEPEGYRATAHQRFVGTGYFDEVAQVVSCGMSSTLALNGSTEEDQFQSAG